MSILRRSTAALILLVTVLAAALSVGSGTSSAVATDEADVELEGEHEGLQGQVVERQVSGDMVVDWLEAPPADAAGWMDDPSGSSGHVHEDTEHGVTVHDAATAGPAPASGAPAEPGQGFAVFSPTARLRSTGYTIRLTGSDVRIEQLRPELRAAAAAASAATGLAIRVADGAGGSAKPSAGEITAVIGQGPCGAGAVGCGGPVLTSTTIAAGRIWFQPAGLRMTPADRSNLAMHELGHALGLRHYDGIWSDQRQVMHSSILGTPTYRSGDGAGLKLMAGGYDAPAGHVARHAYAAGTMRVVGHLVSGSRVRVSVGSASREVRAQGGRFFAEIPAPAGSLRLCATALDSAAGFRRDLGCSDVVAPGEPFGRLEAASASFTSIRVTGWAADPQTAAPVRVEVRNNGALVTTATADGERPDVATGHRHYGAGHGYDLEVPAVAGDNHVCVRVLGVGGGGNADLGCRDFVHAVDPVGAYGIAAVSDAGATVSGWALDPNTPKPVQVAVSVDGGIPAVPGSFQADEHRDDVAREHPAHGPAHGFSELVALTPGEHRLCLTVRNVGLGTDQPLGCHDVVIRSPNAVASAVSTVGSVAATARSTLAALGSIANR